MKIAIIFLALIAGWVGPVLALPAAKQAYQGTPISEVGLVRIAGGNCTGVMITPQTFVSAAHCESAILAASELPNGIVVGQGWGNSGYVRRVVDTRVPAEYFMPKAGAWEWDLMVAKLNRPVPRSQVRTFGREIPAIPFPGTVGGWGIINNMGDRAQNPSGAIVSDWVQASPFDGYPPVSTQDCGKFVGWGVLCQKPILNGGETCAGDSGSPFQVNGIVYGHAVAGYPGCGEMIDFPGYTIDLTNKEYRSWLGKAVSDIAPKDLGVGHAQSCLVDTVTIDGLGRIVLSECADGAEIIFREDGVLIITREQYYGAMSVFVQSDNICLWAFFDGFGEMINKEFC